MPFKINLNDELIAAIAAMSLTLPRVWDALRTSNIKAFSKQHMVKYLKYILFIVVKKNKVARFI